MFGNFWVVAVRAGQGMGWLAFIAALYVLLGALGQLAGCCTVIGMRGIVLYTTVIGALCDMCHVALLGWAMRRIATKDYAGFTVTLNNGMACAVAAVVLSAVTIYLAFMAGRLSALAGRAAAPGTAEKPLHPASPASPAADLSLRLQ